MNVSREIKKNEAIKRMKALGLYKPYINLFIEDDKIFLSEMTGGVFDFSKNADVCEKIKEFETEYNALVYHIIRTVTDFGELFSFLYVSDHKEEWEMDNEDIAEGYALAYVWNRDVDWCSEFGSIGVSSKYGGIIRTA